MHQGQGKCTFPPGAFNCISYKVLGMQQQLKARVISIGTDKRSLHRNSAAFRLGGSLRCIHLEGFLHHLLLLLRFRLNFYFCGSKANRLTLVFSGSCFPCCAGSVGENEACNWLSGYFAKLVKMYQGRCFLLWPGGFGDRSPAKSRYYCFLSSSFCIMTKEKVFW